ncbi:MAG: peptidylprolyl isomerase [Methylobacillus sp.]|jgi:peptidyl-prolyl cis-trans isomerase SurA|nr:peptidylprolyl isomerase [Methylobacillus sp.]
MKTLILRVGLLSAIFFLFFSATVSAAPALDDSQIDRIVAVVNDDVITYGELQDRIQLVLGQIEKQGMERPPQDVLEKQVLERLISDRLQLQLAAQTGLRVDDAQLDKTIERIADQNKLTPEEFRDALAQGGMDFRKFREDIRNEIIIARLRDREVDGRINVTEAEIDDLLTSQAARGEIRDEFDLSHILIRTPEESSPEELQPLRAKAEEALKLLREGEDFSQVSARFSDAPNALEGGALGWKNDSQIPKLFIDALAKLQPGQVTDIIRSPNGFHILKLNNRRGGASPMIVQQTSARHILIKPSEIVTDDDAQRRLLDLKERIENGGDFAELARQYSEDDGSAAKGGELGWVNPGDTVPEFEKTMNALQPGQLSDPVRTPFGWHLIQVIGRRDQDMSKEAVRLKARQEIRARKSDEAFQDWLRELRDRAYVEYRLEDKY